MNDKIIEEMTKVIDFTEDGICEGYARPNQVYYTKSEAEAKFKELKE